MTVALLFALAPLVPVTLLVLMSIGGWLRRYYRALWPRNLWYPKGPGDVIEVRTRFTYDELAKITGDKDVSNYKNMHETALDSNSRYMVIGLDLERATGPMLSRRKCGRVAMMGTGETHGMQMVEWYEGSKLANEGFQKYFRRIVIQDKYKKESAKRAEQLLADKEEEEAHEI